MIYVNPVSITRVRRSGGGVDPATGRPAATTDTSTNIIAELQPIDGRDIERLPEGERSDATHKAYVVRGALRATDAAAGVLSDLVVYDGTTYEVETTADYTGPIPHTRAYLRAVRE